MTNTSTTKLLSQMDPDLERERHEVRLVDQSFPGVEGPKAEGKQQVVLFRMNMKMLWNSCKLLIFADMFRPKA